MPKKPPANAFYFFMLERKASYEKNGDRFPGGLKEVAEIAGPEWEVLPASQKKKFEDMAKKEKERLKGDDARKYTNQHNSFESLNKNRMELEARNKNISKNIEMTIRTLCDTNKITNFPFYLIHVNYFVKSDGQCYHPAELAVCEFSLAEGVTNVYHTIVNAGVLPMGYRYDAISQSDSVHHIPLDSNLGEKNYYNMWQNVKDLLRGKGASGGGYPPMYTMPDNPNLNTSISCACYTVQMMCDTCDDNPDDFPVYPLEKLFYELKSGCATMNGEDDPSKYFPSVPFASSVLENDLYNFCEEIACDFHREDDSVNNCSKSFVQRWAFIICDQVCESVGIHVIPGKHVPLNSDVTFTAGPKETYQPPQTKSKTWGSYEAPRTSKPFRMVHASGKVKKFASVEMEPKPLAAPRTQPAFVRPTPRQNYEGFDQDFPEITIGRGRGRHQPARGGSQGGFGRGGMSFSEAMQHNRRQ